MTFLSYAQNFEDVMLRRALKSIGPGFYIDVGAHDPAIDSVTKAFYDLGWRGINLEPVVASYQKLERDRPEDVNLQMALGADAEEARFYEVVGTGLSTMDGAIALRHARELGFEINNYPVSVDTLTRICEQYAPTDIHFLKIDVEGAEKAVLLGMDFNRFRPWIVLLEATEPNSQVTNFEDWEDLLLQAGYEFVYFDGLNRFYLANEHSDLKSAFEIPPNCFDNFIQVKEGQTPEQPARYESKFLPEQEGAIPLKNKPILLIDYTPAIGESAKRGIGLYVKNTVRACLKLKEKYPFEIKLLVQSNREQFSSSLDVLRDQYQGIDIFIFNPISRVRFPNAEKNTIDKWHEIGLADLINESGADVFWASSPFSSDIIIPDLAQISPDIKVIATAYDFIPLIFPEWYLKPSRILRDHYMHCLKFLRKCDQVLAISQCTQKDAARFLGLPEDKVPVVYAGYDREWALAQGSEGSVAAKIPQGLQAYVLYVAGYDHRKNYEEAVDIFAALPAEVREGYQLCLIARAMPNGVKSGLYRKMRAQGAAKDDLIILDYVSDVELAALYKNASCLLFPSKYEGFGLPVIEALLNDCPVLCADGSAIPEVVTSKDARYQPGNIEEAQRKLTRILSDKAFSQSLLESGAEHVSHFTWDFVAENSLQTATDILYLPRSDVLERRKTNLQNPKIAIVGGISQDSADSTTLISHIHEISLGTSLPDIFLPRGDNWPDAFSAFSQFPLEAFEAMGHQYDFIIYVLDGAQQSAKILEWATLWRGIFIVLAWPLDRQYFSDATLKMFRFLSEDGAGVPLESVAGEEVQKEDKLYLAFLQNYLDGIFIWREAAADFDLSVLSPKIIAGQDDVQLPLQAYFSKGSGVNARRTLIEAGVRVAQETPEMTEVVIETLASPVHKLGEPKIFLEMYHFWEQAAKGYITGIQRVVGCVYEEIGKEQQDPKKVIPVRYQLTPSAVRYYTGKITAGSNWEVERLEAECRPKAGDVYMVLDLVHELLGSRQWEQESLRLKRDGVSIHAVLYDLLPVQYPKYFEKHFQDLHAKYLHALAQTTDHVHCISRTVADEFITFLEKNRIEPKDGFKVDWWHLGSNISNECAIEPEIDESEGQKTLLQFLAGNQPTYLMVGTIEQRKKHEEVLDAFENLWAKGFEGRLVVLGKKGWLSDEIYSRLKEANYKQESFLYLEDVSDIVLNIAYAKADFLVAASVAEGFGLPLLEAAQLGCAVIARDIPVFREILGDKAYFFSHSDAPLTTVIECAAVDLSEGPLIKPDLSVVKSWVQSAEDLMQQLKSKDAYRVYRNGQWEAANCQDGKGEGHGER
jgi:FkbM family methyltransferase